MFLRLLISILLFMSFTYAVTVTDEVVESDQSITLQSEEKIFDDTTLYTHKKLLSCTPPIDAVYKYHSSKKLEILPRQPLKSSHRYVCELAREWLHDDINEELTFAFETEEFGLLDWHYRDREKLLEIVLNDQVDLKNAKESIKLYKMNNLAHTELHYKLSSQDGRRLLLKITEATGDNLKLQLLPSLTTASGDRLGSEVIKTIEKLRPPQVKLNDKVSEMIMEDEPIMVSNDDGSFSIRLFFEDNFDENPIIDFIELEGIEDFQVKQDIYLDYEDREELGLEDSFYAIDITSPEFQANSSYKLTLKKGLRHYYAQLKDDISFTFDTGDRKSGILIEADKPYMSHLGEIGFSSINISKATVIVDKITHDNYRYFINYHQGILKGVQKFTEEIFAKDITLDNPHNQIQKQKILLKDLTQKATNGVYRVTIQYEDRDSDGEIVDRSASKVIFVSDIGISANLSNEQAFVSLLRLSDGTPIEGATVELYSANNILIATANSDRDGIAIIDKKLLLSKKPKAIIISTPKDRSFLLLNKSLNSVNYKTLKREVERYRAFIYFQSDIIRPSGVIHAMITVKDRDFISASDIPLKVTLAPLQDGNILEEVHTTDTLGIIDFSHKMSNEDTTGAYQLKVWLGKKMIGKKIIDVEAFMPPQIENSIKTDKPFYSGDDYIKATISSSYLFGAPSADLSGKVNYSAIAHDFSHKEFKDYSFSNGSLNEDNEQLYLDITQDIILDEEGKIELLLPCRVDQEVPSILKATIGATIMDDTQPVATYREIYIYPYKHMVGIKSDQGSIESGQIFKAKAILIDPLTMKPAERELSVLIKKRNWHYSYSDGKYNWESETETIDSFDTPANQDFQRTLQSNGDYIIEVHDRLGGHSASVDLEVSGWGYTNISPKADLKRVEISFEDKLYSRGDRLKASFKSPILKGYLLITVEGDKVYWHKSIAIDKGAAQVDIPLDMEMGHGLYLHATAVRKTDTHSSIIPFRAMGYEFIKPNRDKHRITITLDCNETTPSRHTTPLSITTDRESALLVSVVDAGILNITEQKPPKIFDFFNQQADQKLLYFDIYEKVMNYLTEGNIIAFGAGDIAVEKRKKHLAPENIDRVKPFMLWSNIIYTKDKKASYNLEIPEFNGKATIVVVALDANSIGVESRDLIIKDDIMIKPSYPRFILKGDKVKVPIRIFNTTQSEKIVQLTKSVSSNLTMKFDDDAFAVAPNSSTLITAQLEATQEGKGSIKLQIELDGQTFSNSVKLMVMSPYVLQSKLYQGATTKPVIIDIPAKYSQAKALVGLSDNLLGQLYGDLKYLVGYPYGCAEQTSSKIAAMFYAKPFMREDKLLSNSKNYIQQGVKKLSNQQNGYGEFAYWEPDGYINAYASLYASETLLDLNASGVYLDDDVKQRIFKALDNIVQAKNRLSAKYDKPLRIYAAYILSIHGKLPQSSANMLYDKKIYNSYYLSYYYMSALLKNIGNEKLSKEVYAHVAAIRLSDIEKVDYSDTTRAFASRSRDMFLVFYLNSKYFTKNQEDYQDAKRQLSKLYSTQEKALAFRAIATYLGEAIQKDMGVNIIINGEKESYDKTTAFTRKMLGDRIVIDPFSGVVNYTVELFKPLPHPIKNRLSQQKKLSISREFIDIDGDQVNLKNLEQGSKIYSKVTLGNMASIDNIVLNERIPACMDIVNTRISKSNSSPFKDVNLDLDYKDIRDDRVLHFLSVDKKTKREKIPGSNKTRVVILQNKTVIYTPLIATTLGECHLPAVSVEAMYDSRINDYAKQTETVIVKTKQEISQQPQTGYPPRDEVKELVREFYMLEASNADPQDFLKYFHFPVKHYFSRDNVSKSYILKNKEQYNGEWAKKSYSIQDIQIVSEDSTLHNYQVKIIFKYTLDNGHKKLRGTSKHLLTITEKDSKLGIDGIEIAR